MVRSRTSTAPTCLRSQVARVATTRATFMKYSSQLTRLSIEPPVRCGMLPHGSDAAERQGDYHAGMVRPLALLLAALPALPALALGPLEPSGHLPPVNPPGPVEQPGKPPRKATPVEPPAPLP